MAELAKSSLFNNYKGLETTGYELVGTEETKNLNVWAKKDGAIGVNKKNERFYLKLSVNARLEMKKADGKIDIYYFKTNADLKLDSGQVLPKGTEIFRGVASGEKFDKSLFSE